MRPTYLYIKKHNKTGLMYFGRTIKDPYVYPGSGTYWSKHIKIYGNDVSTIWTLSFYDMESLIEFALFFSEEFDIVNSKQWANVVPETGISTILPGKDHPRYGKKNSEKNKLEKSLAMKGKGNHFFGKRHTEDSRKLISKSKTGKKSSEETKKKLSIARKKFWEENPNFGQIRKKPDKSYLTPEFRKRKSEQTTGENNPNYGKGEHLRKINKDIYPEVIAKYRTMKYSQGELADMYNVSSVTIKRILSLLPIEERILIRNTRRKKF